MDEPASDTMDAPIIMVGGSNAGRLGVSLDNIGRPAVDVTSSGWTLTPTNINIIKGLLEAECITKPDSPVVIYALDNSCFMNISADGTISPIKKLEDGKYHVVGDLAITPGILLRHMYAGRDHQDLWKPKDLHPHPPPQVHPGSLLRGWQPLHQPGGQG
jgi:hypothetical protein